MTGWRLSWPPAWGGPVGEGRLRTVPADFFVEEVLGRPLSGQGEHLYLFLQKEGENTEYVARELARLSDCRSMDVGYSGLKDRNAVTRQWFSLYRPGHSDRELLAAIRERWPVLESARHDRKLRRGTHVANRFELILRELTADPELLVSRLEAVAAQGCPNYFGPQRFGRGGANLDAAAGMDPRRLRGRNFKRGIYLSSVRSWLFNEYLARRVEAGDWRQCRRGDPGLERPTGPLYGDGGSDVDEPLRTEENRVIEPYPVFRRLLDGARVRPERRELVLRPTDLDWHLTDDCLALKFALPKGGYATALLAEVLRVFSKPVE